jgi:alkylation response protein AidB-like acyl-CoA dehydrogenase
MTVDYAKLRKQFGRTIGSFQAIKHILAEAKLDEYGLSCVANRLSEELEDGSENDGGAMAAMRALCHSTRSAQTVLDNCLQVHGGIGFTLEYALSWYYNRAAGLWGLWGDPNRLALQIAARHQLNTSADIGSTVAGQVNA